MEFTFLGDWQENQYRKYSMRKNARIGVLLITSILLSLSSNVFSDDRVEGKKPSPKLWVSLSVLCKKVDGKREPVSNIKNGATITSGSVCVWAAISGDEESLKLLRKEKTRKGKKWALPIRHQWFYTDKLDFADSPPAEQLQDPEPLKAGTIRSLAKLEAEVAAKAAFDWRTISRKKKFRRGTYVVRVVDLEGNPILGADGKKSELWFKYDPKD